MSRTIGLLIIAFLISFTLLAAGSDDISKSSKIKIQSAEDLPHTTYQLPGTLTELIQSEEKFDKFALQIRQDVEEILSKYEIEDKRTLRRYYNVLKNLDMFDGDYDAALEHDEMIRELQEKPASKLISGAFLTSYIKAYKEIGNETSAEFGKTLEKYYALKINSLPWEIVENRIIEAKSDAEMLGGNFLLGIIQNQYEPGVTESGSFSDDIAIRVINARFMIRFMAPYQEERIRVLGTYIKAHKVEKEDIWEARSVVLTDDQKLSPVTVAIWDTGVDPFVFKGRMFINKSEKLDGVDNDKNGFVDDIHGIAYDVDQYHSSGCVFPLDKKAVAKLPELKAKIKGFMDLQSGIESPEAGELKQFFASLEPEMMKPFMEEIMLMAYYMHGTFSAGVAVDGNPFTKILIVREEPDNSMIPRVPTIEHSKLVAANYKESIEYMQKHDVRIANLSWGDDPESYVEGLEANGIGKDAEERARMGREMFEIVRDALYDAMANAPEILFVAAAGNSNNDIDFDEFIPACFNLPNVLAVGAVDKAGDETVFTSFGKSVDLYASGSEVESFVPGGEIMAASGTSASAPQVVNLAAKLLALDPSLSVSDVVSLIKNGTDMNTNGRCNLLNPKKSVELLRKLK